MRSLYPLCVAKETRILLVSLVLLRKTKKRFFVFSYAFCSGPYKRYVVSYAKPSFAYFLRSLLLRSKRWDNKQCRIFYAKDKIKASHRIQASEGKRVGGWFYVVKPNNGHLRSFQCPFFYCAKEGTLLGRDTKSCCAYCSYPLSLIPYPFALLFFSLKVSRRLESALFFKISIFYNTKLVSNDKNN